MIDAQKNALQHCSIVRVTSNRRAAYGLTRAEEANIPTSYHNLLEYKKQYPFDFELARSKYDLDLVIALLQDEPDIVVCAGWMHILTPTFLDRLSVANVPVINIHPALPGAYNGAGAIERAHQDWKDGKIEKTGIMVHYVISQVDMGEPILVKEIPFMEGVDEDIEKLKERMHEEEHRIIVTGTKIAVERLRKPGAS